MANIIDELQIQINAKANTRSITSMTQKLEKLSDSIQKLTSMTGGLNDVGKAFGNLNQNIAGMQKVNVKLTQSTQQVGKSYQTVRTIVDGVFKAMGDSIRTTVRLVKNLSSAVVSLGKGAFNATASSMKGLFTFILKSSNPLAFNIGKLSSGFKSLLGTMIGFYGIRSVFSWMKEAVVSGADIAETNHIVEETFRDLSGTIDIWAQNSMKQFGMSANAAKRYAGVLSSMFQASSIEYEKAGKMATDLTGLAGDLASFYNIDIAAAYKKIQSGMAGQSRPLLALGIDLRVASLEAFRMSQGIDKSYQSMNTAEKTMLRYQYLMSVTSRQQGDFARTAGSMANQLRIFKSYASAITATIGDGLASALRHVIKYLNIFMSYVYQAVQVFATFMKTIFGANISGGGFVIDEDLGDADDYMDDLADGASGAADGLGDAADNAKQLKKELSVLPFDELNQLNKQPEASSSGGTSGGGGAGGGGKGFGDVGTALFDIEDLMNQGGLPEAISAWGQQIRAAFENQQWNTLGNVIAMGINQAVEKVYAVLDPQKVKAKVFPYIDAFTTTFNSLIYHLDFDMIGRTLGRGIQDILLVLSRLLTGINWKLLGKSWANYFNGIFEEVSPEDVGRTIANAFNAINRYLWGAVLNINWKNIGSFVSRSINSLIAYADFLTLADTISQGINGLNTAFFQMLDPQKGIQFDVLARKLGNALVKMIAGIKWDVIGQNLGLLWNSAWTFLKTFIITLGNDGEGTGLGQGILTALQNAISIAHSSIGDVAGAILGLVKAIASDIAIAFSDTRVFMQLGTDIGTVIGDILSDQATWDKVAEAINNIASSMVAFFKGLFNALYNRRGEIMTAISGFFKKLDWGEIFLAFAPLAAGVFAIKLLSFTSATLRAAFKEVLANFLAERIKAAFGAKMVKEAAEAGLSSVATEAGEAAAVSHGLDAALGGAALQAGLTALSFAGFVGVCAVGLQKVQKFTDVLNGGNGILTETGAAVDTLITKLASMGSITGDTAKAIFDLKEAWENDDVTDDDFVVQFSKIIEEAGISAEEAELIIRDLGTGINGLTENQMTTLLSLIEKVPEGNNKIEESLESLNIGDPYGAITGSLARYLAEMGDGTGTLEIFAAALDEGMGNGYGIAPALRNATNAFLEAGGSTELLREALGDDIFFAFIESTDEASAKVEAFKLLVEKAPKTEAIQTVTSAFDTAKQAVNNAATGAWNWLTATGTDPNTKGIEAATASMEKNAEQTGKSAENQEAYNEAAEATPKSSTTAANTIVSVITTLLSALGIRVAVKTATSDAPNGIADSFNDSKDKLSTKVWVALNNVLVNAGKNAKKDSKTQGEGIVEGMSDGMEYKFPTIIATTGDMCDSITSTTQKLLDEHSPSRVMAEHGKNVVLGLVEGINGSQRTLLDSTRTVLVNLTSDISRTMSTLNDSMYTAGHNLMQSFANGLSSVRVRVPHIYVSSWNTTYYGNGGWFQTPNFGVSWYGKGGLFTSPSLVAGLGEAGNEAVLPLENKRTMGMIADAITENGGSSLGVSAEDLQEAVATGVAMAMAQNPQTVQINVHSELRTNDETLAESVSRGQARLDRRYNATPSYGY